MPRGQFTKEEMRAYVLRLKGELCNENPNLYSDSKHLANSYLNKVLDKLEEFRF
jgi:hypothetical protein